MFHLFLFLHLSGTCVKLFLHHRLLCNNRFEGSIPLELKSLRLLSDVEIDDHLTSTGVTGFSCVNRKFGHWYDTVYCIGFGFGCIALLIDYFAHLLVF